MSDKDNSDYTERDHRIDQFIEDLLAMPRDDRDEVIKTVRLIERVEQPEG